MLEYTPATPPVAIGDALGARASRLGRFASRLVYYETVSSTNDVASRLASDGAPHGTVVTADAQDRGRGRMGRSWFSPPGAGLYVSVILRPEVLGDVEAVPGRNDPDVSLASAVTLTAGVALAEAIQAATGLPVDIKWPNDLVVGRRKLAGILAEASVDGEGLRHVVLGYGINVQPAAYPPDIAARATSLEVELGRPVDRADVLAETLARLAELMETAFAVPDGRQSRERESGGRAPLALMLDRWRALSPSSRGAAVEVLDAGERWVSGITAGIDVDGALLVSVAGVPRRVIAGEVRWL